MNNELINRRLDQMLDDSEHSSVGEGMQDAFKQGLAIFFKAGMNEAIQTISSYLATLEANLDNKKLSDEEFRELVRTVLEQVRS